MIAAEIAVLILISPPGAMDGERGRSEVPAPDDDSRRVPDLWLFSESEQLNQDRPAFIAVIIGVGLDPGSASRWARLWTMPHIEWQGAAAAGAPPDLDRAAGDLRQAASRLIAFFCLFPILLNAIDGVRGIEPTLMETARSYCIPWRETVRRIVVLGNGQIVAGAVQRLSPGDHHGAG